jgi:DMSO/TMAO reductase YedYZ molybdopterin-dependent catalytic subunit
MPGKIERSIDELYQDDRERADAVAFGRRTGLHRRGFLGGTGLAAMGVAVGGSIPFAENIPGGLIPAALIPPAMAQAPAPSAAPKGPQYLNFPGKADKLVVLGERPLVAETPEHLLDDDTTPIDKFFIRNNGQMPEAAKDPDAWKIVVDGEVNQKLELTLAELKAKFRPVTRRLVLECGGNGRSFFATQARGNQWTNGGVGCAEWTGVRLADVLKAAGVKPSAVFTGNYGATRATTRSGHARPIRAASCSRMWRATGIRRAMAPIRCTGSRFASHDAVARQVRPRSGCAGARGGSRRGAGSGLHASRREPGGLSVGRRTRADVLCLHALPRIQDRRAAGPDPPAVERHPRLDDAAARNAAAERQRPQSTARLSRGSVPRPRAARMAESIPEMSGVSRNGLKR